MTPETPLKFRNKFVSDTRMRRFSPIFFALLLACTLLLQTGEALADDIRQTFMVPRDTRGLGCAWGKVWVGGIGDRGGYIWGYDPESGQLIDSMVAPIPDCLGMEGFDGGLAYISMRSDSVFLITRAGVSTIAKPIHYLAGLASDGRTLWGASYFQPQGAIYQFDLNGRVLNAVPFIGRHSRDMAYLKGRLYIADQLAGYVRIINSETGRLIRAMNTPGINPSGLASDGEDLWVLDEGDQKATSRVYRIYVRPEGGIRFSSLSHNFGSVVIDQSRDWTVWVYNDGPRDTRLLNFEARDGNDNIFVPHVWSFPNSIAAGDSAALVVSFSPGYPDSVHIFFALTYDLDRIENVVNLRGKGVNPQRDFQIAPPRNLEFGLAYWGPGMQISNLRMLTVENNGGTPVTIRELRFADTTFNSGNYPLPQTLREPGAYRIPIFFRPNATREFRSQVTVVTDDPDSPQIVVYLHGNARANIYPGGSPLWNVTVGTGEGSYPNARAILPIDDITGDGLADVVVAANDFTVTAYHAAVTQLPVPYWVYRTDDNPWRSGCVAGQRAMSPGGDWNRDGIGDIVVGFDGGALTLTALSGRDGHPLWIIDTHSLRGAGGIVNVAQGTTDFTGDGVNDVYAACAASGEEHSTNAVFMVDGRTTRMTWLHPLRTQPFDVRLLQDVTGDGVQDLVVATIQGEIIALDGREGNEIWNSHYDGDLRQIHTLPDVNGDHSLDVCIVTQAHGITMLNGSNGTTLWVDGDIPRSVSSCVLDDVNNNGAVDLVVGDENSFLRCFDGRTGVAAWDTTLYVGARPIGLDVFGDIDHDGVKDFLAGTAEGRLLALSGNGRDGLWSYSNVGAGHGFRLVFSSRDIDGNGERDVFAAMENGMVYAFAGSYAGMGVTGLEDPSASQTILLDPAYPNPFNSTVTIPFALSRPGDVNLQIFDVSGREVTSLQLGQMPIGRHRVAWDGSSASGGAIPSGFYLVRIESGDLIASQRIQLLK